MGKEEHGLILFAGVAIAIIGVISWRKYIFQKRRLKRLKQGSVNIGGIFGMDVGGTLTKIVYFEPIITAPSSSTKPFTNAATSNKNINNNPHSNNLLITPQGSPSRMKLYNSTQSIVEGKSDDIVKPISTLKRSDSLNKLDLPDHQEALHQLYKDFSNVDDKKAGTTREDALSFYSPILGGRLNFLHFETRNLVSTVNVLSANAVTDNIRSIGCTGGGAIKYAKFFQEEQDITITPYDELASLVTGMNFTLSNVEGECYTYREQPVTRTGTAAVSAATATGTNINGKATNNEDSEEKDEVRWRRDIKDRTEKVIIPFDIFSSSSSAHRTRGTDNVPSRSSTRTIDSEPSTPQYQPYLVVNVGSGVSILKVTSPTEFERVSGTSLGGGTYWGLCRLLTHCSRYEEVLDMAESGDASEVDMLVRDIYGGDYDLMHLSGSMVASSFGKIVMKDNPRDGIKEEDFAIALLMMITNNIGQIAYLNAKLHGCTKIFFVGSFLRHNSISCRRLAFAIDFWSKGEMEALFLKHEGYFGALGTFLMSAFGEDLDKALSLDSQRRVLERFNHTDVSGGGGSNSNGAASSGSSGGNRRDSGGQGVPTGVTSPGAKFFLSSTADGSALKFVKRSRRDINNSSNNSGDRTGDNSGGSSSGNGKGMLYGIEREFLDRIRAWEPLSFANFRFHLSGDSSSRSSDSDGEKIVDKSNSTNWWFPMNKKPNDDESLLSMNGSTVLPINRQSLSQSVDIFPPVVAKSRSHSDMFPSVESQTTTHKNGVSGSTDSEGAVNPTVSSSPIHPSISQRSMSMSDERPSTHSERTSISGTGNSSSSNLFSIGMSYDDSSLPSCHSPVSTMYPANSPR